MSETDRREPNHFVTLRARPVGIAGPEHFEFGSGPVRAPGPGEAQVETLYLSVDPAMRVWLDEDPGYVPPVPIGGIMRGTGVGRVAASSAEGLRPGDLVMGPLGWQSRPTVAAASLLRIDPDLGTPLDWIGPLGTTALTAYFGLKDVGAVRPGETVLVSAAAGAVGQMAAQIARAEGCRVVGIAGGPDKCRFLMEDLGLDAAIDHRAAPDLEASIRRLCPEGVDVFFDNVGGPTLEAAIANLRQRGRVVVCGRISQTAAAVPHGVRNLGLLIGRRARIEGFIVSDYAARFDEARRWLGVQIDAGRIGQKLHVLVGLERAPDGLAMLFRGENQGKLVVKVAT